MFLYSALVALILAVLIIGGMWSIVLLVANAPGRLRSLKFWSRTATMHSQTSCRCHREGPPVNDPDMATSQRSKVSWLF